MNLLPDPPVGTYHSTALAKADFNNDGQVDICIESTNAFFATTFGVGIVLSTGTGSYSSFPTYSLGPNYVIHVTAGDFTNDGNQDVIAVCDNDSAFYLLEGNGAGGFLSKTTYTTNAVPSSLVAADFNNDGKLDIAYSCASSPSLSLSYGGLGGFQNPVNYSLASIPNLLVPADFNNDNILDILALSGTTSYFLQGAANGTFAVANSINLNVANVIAEDVDQDNKLDLICSTNNVSNTLSILKGNGNFTFGTALNYPVTGIGGGLGIGPVACADFDNDGKKDLATLASGFMTGYICLFPGLGNGSFSAPVTYSLNFYTGFFLFYNFVVADFNNDTRPDIIALVSDDGVDPFSVVKLYENCQAVTVGIKETGNSEMNFNLSPNPAGDFMQVFMDNKSDEFRTATVYNDLGQIVMEKKLGFENGKALIKTGELPNGVYTLLLNGNSLAGICKRFAVEK